MHEIRVKKDDHEPTPQYRPPLFTKDFFDSLIRVDNNNQNSENHISGGDDHSLRPVTKFY